MRIAAALTLFAALATPTASAVEIWATDVWGEVNSGSVGDQLIKFDSASPSTVEVVGATGIANSQMAGLDFAGGTLYAYVQNGASGLYTIDRNTGAATFVGSGGLEPGDQISDLSYNPADGKMYGVATTGVVAVGTNLYSFDLATGQATLEKVLYVPTRSALVLINGLATDADGTQYALDLNNNGVFRIDGNDLVFLGAEGFNSNRNQGLTIDWAGDRTLYHGAWNEDIFDACARLYNVNKTTGVGTDLGAIGPLHMGQSKYAIGDIAIFPEPATLGIVMLGVLTLRRR